LSRQAWLFEGKVVMLDGVQCLGAVCPCASLPDKIERYPGMLEPETVIKRVLYEGLNLSNGYYYLLYSALDPANDNLKRDEDSRRYSELPLEGWLPIVYDLYSTKAVYVPLDTSEVSPGYTSTGSSSLTSSNAYTSSSYLTKAIEHIILEKISLYNPTHIPMYFMVDVTITQSERYIYDAIPGKDPPPPNKFAGEVLSKHSFEVYIEARRTINLIIPGLTFPLIAEEYSHIEHSSEYFIWARKGIAVEVFAYGYSHDKEFRDNNPDIPIVYWVPTTSTSTGSTTSTSTGSTTSTSTGSTVSTVSTITTPTTGTTVSTISTTPTTVSTITTPVPTTKKPPAPTTTWTTWTTWVTPPTSWTTYTTTESTSTESTSTESTSTESTSTESTSTESTSTESTSTESTVSFGGPGWYCYLEYFYDSEDCSGEILTTTPGAFYISTSEDFTAFTRCGNDPDYHPGYSWRDVIQSGPYANEGDAWANCTG
jgi:hypothetical protein